MPAPDPLAAPAATGDPQGQDPPYDVVVVGAGPAGSSAARLAAQAGAGTLVLDRASFPRYKTCGGGIIGTTIAHLPAGFDLPVQQRIDRATFTWSGRRPVTRTATDTIVRLVNRVDLDHRLLQAAADAGAQVREGVTVTAVAQDAQGVTLSTSAGPVRARWVVGADGSTSRLARHVGIELAQTDLGLEVELDAGSLAASWAGRIAIDFGAEPGSYAWVFPKEGVLTVGVIMAKGAPDKTRDYLADFVAQQGLSRLREIRSSGHLTRCRTPQSPLGLGRILLVGDAAGLLEPWTREGISYAVRSGSTAGEVLGTTYAAPNPAATQAAYRTAIERTLGREMAAGTTLLAAFERHPALFHQILARGPWGWRAFCQVTTEPDSIARMLGRRPTRGALAVLDRITR